MIISGFVVTYFATIFYSWFLKNRNDFAIFQKISTFLFLGITGNVGVAMMKKGFDAVGLTSIWTELAIVVGNCVLGFVTYAVIAAICRLIYDNGYRDGVEASLQSSYAESRPCDDASTIWL